MIDVGSKVRIKPEVRDKYKQYLHKFTDLEVTWISFYAGILETAFPKGILPIDDIEEYNMDTEVLLNKLTKAISHAYKEDKTAPGLTVSALKKGYYCSVVRYDGAFGAGKRVICKARGDSLGVTLKDVATQFLNITTQVKDPVQELNELVSSK
jgi:hypothetical protein